MLHISILHMQIQIISRECVSHVLYALFAFLASVFPFSLVP